MSDADEALIVIPCLNEAATLPELLATLRAENPQALIVVADGGSTDGSQDIVAARAVEEDRTVLLHNPDRRQSAGINLAIATFGDKARWLVRVDAHCDYPPDYAARLIAAAAAREAAAVVVPMVSTGIGCFQRACAAAQNSKLGTGGSPHRHLGTGCYVDHGHHALMDITLFRRAGGYRADMSHNEDAELDHRMAVAGGRIWLEPSLALLYFPRRTPGSLFRQYWGYGRGRAWTSRLHRMPLKPRQFVPLGVPAAIALATLTPLSTVFLLPAAIWIAACGIGGIVIGWRAGNACALLSGAAAMIMHVAWGTGFLYETIVARR